MTLPETPGRSCEFRWISGRQCALPATWITTDGTSIRYCHEHACVYADGFPLNEVLRPYPERRR